MIRALYTVECDGCSNVPGFHCEFSTITAAQADALAKGWFLGPFDVAVCPYCRKAQDTQGCQVKHRDGRVCGQRSENHRCFPNG